LKGVLVFGHFAIYSPILFLQKEHKGPFKEPLGRIKNSNPLYTREGEADSVQRREWLCRVFCSDAKQFREKSELKISKVARNTKTTTAFTKLIQKRVSSYCNILYHENLGIQFC
jgi:hypothetical protein